MQSRSLYDERQNILALRHPRSRLYMQGMQGKHSRNEAALPEGSCHPSKNQEQQQGIRYVK
jgi:hypothetical protein